MDIRMKARTIRQLAPVLLIVLVSLLYTGSDYGVADQTIELPLAKYFANPALYPGDAGIQAWTKFPTPFWFIVGRLSLFVDLELLVRALHILVRCGVLFAAYALALALTESSSVSLLSTLVKLMWFTALVFPARQRMCR